VRAVLIVLARFISCGVLGVAVGVLWRFTLAPPRVGLASAFAGIFFLLLGFIVGGSFWYAHDARVRSREPERMSEERLAFSLVVFAGAPLAVLVVIGVIWLIAFVIGAA
jgi:putative flippase GtrA